MNSVITKLHLWRKKKAIVNKPRILKRNLYVVKLRSKSFVIKRLVLKLRWQKSTANYFSVRKREKLSQKMRRTFRMMVKAKEILVLNKLGKSALLTSKRRNRLAHKVIGCLTL